MTGVQTCALPIYEHDHPVPPVIPPIIEDEVAPIPEPDHKAPVDVEEELVDIEEEDPEEDPLVVRKDDPIAQPNPLDNIGHDDDNEPVELVAVMDDALPDADLDDDDDEDIDINGVTGEEFAPGRLLAEGMMFSDFDPWLNFMPADVLTVPEDEIPLVVTDDEADFYASIH